MPYFNNDLSYKVFPSIEQLSGYLKKANDFDKRDPRQLMSFLQRLAEVDGRLMGLIHKRKMGPKSLKYDIRLPLEFKISDKEKARLSETKRRFRNSNIKNLIEDIVEGVLYSMSAVRLVWANTQFGTMVVRKSTYDLTDLDFSDESDGLSLITQNAKGDLIKNELDPETHIITRFNPLRNRPNFIGSYMRSAMLLSWLKYNSKWDWRDLLKRHGVPSIFGQYPEHFMDDKPKLNQLISSLEKIKSDSLAVLPDTVKLLFDESLKSSNTESFEKFINAANTELDILFHGQNLTTEINKSGSRSAAEVHNQIDDLIIVGEDIEMVQQIITNQYLKKDYQLNYGEPENDYFEFVVVQDEQEDFESNSRIISNLFSDPQLKEKIPIKKSELYSKIGFSQPAEDDEII